MLILCTSNFWHSGLKCSFVIWRSKARFLKTTHGNGEKCHHSAKLFRTIWEILVFLHTKLDSKNIKEFCLTVSQWLDKKNADAGKGLDMLNLSIQGFSDILWNINMIDYLNFLSVLPWDRPLLFILVFK